MNRPGAWRRVSAAVLGAGTVAGAGMVGAAGAGAAPIYVRGGETFTTTVPGFAPGTVVQRRLDLAVVPEPLQADRDGAVHVSMTVPATLGRHQLVLIGAVASPQRAAPTDAAAAPGEDRQAVVVTVPLLVTFEFDVIEAPIVLGESTDGDQGGHGARDAGAGRLAATGIDVLAGLAIGTVLAVAGGLVAWCGRRRVATRSPRRATPGESA